MKVGFDIKGLLLSTNIIVKYDHTKMFVPLKILDWSFINSCSKALVKFYQSKSVLIIHVYLTEHVVSNCHKWQDKTNFDPNGLETINVKMKLKFPPEITGFFTLPLL